jgi:beta-lactamase regulating signal transducer with metallopeptidase domain/Spy/CpxP family protein refolding chaperone
MTDWLLGTLAWTSFLSLVVLIVRGPVRRRFGARAAYMLWLVPTARLFMPTLTTTVERIAPQRAPTASLSDLTPYASVTEPHLMSAVGQAGMLDQIGGLGTVATIVWVTVAMWFFIKGLEDYRADRRALFDGSVPLARIGSIRLVRSPAARCPMAFGLIDRVVVVPPDFDRRYSERERCLALEHELSHHRSGDLVANAFAFVLLCLQWFNPLAWVAHAAFRFDQECACDARVLDKVTGADREHYGRAIAKAASGRTMLFAAALDRPGSMHRRLKTMIEEPASHRRNTGIALAAIAILIALPLTATRAVDYVDVQAPTPPAAPSPAQAPRAPSAPLAPLAVAAGQVAPTAPLAPVPPVPPVPPVHVSKRGGLITINGRTVRQQDLTPADRAMIRRSLDEARRSLASARIDRDEARREAEQALRVAQADRAEAIRDARDDMADAMREIDANAADIRRGGRDPEQIKAQVRAAMASVNAADIERQVRASVNPELIERSLRSAEAAINRSAAELDRIEAQVSGN